MADHGIELTWQQPLPVMGQIAVLEAFEYIYSTLALAELGPAKGTSHADLQAHLSSAPGKLLDPDNFVYVSHVRNGSIGEIVIGTLSALRGVLWLLREYRQFRKENTSEDLNWVRKELLPTLAQLKKLGGSDEKLKEVTVKVYQFLDGVIARHMQSGHVDISELQPIPATVSPCPTCHGTGRI